MRLSRWQSFSPFWDQVQQLQGELNRVLERWGETGGRVLGLTGTRSHRRVVHPSPHAAASRRRPLRATAQLLSSTSRPGGGGKYGCYPSDRQALPDRRFARHAPR